MHRLSSEPGKAISATTFLAQTGYGSSWIAAERAGDDYNVWDFVEVANMIEKLLREDSNERSVRPSAVEEQVLLGGQP